jgi:catechol 2,3-dioxygenase-like lactoylglutathione lyase family enzyme
MDTVRGLHHVAMHVRDINRSIAFYQEAFGFTLVRRWGGEDSPAVMLDIGDGAILELFQKEAAGSVGTLLQHIAVGTDDVDAAYHRAISAGAGEQVAPKDVTIPSEPPFPVRLAFVIGPDGEPIELFCES